MSDFFGKPVNQTTKAKEWQLMLSNWVFVEGKKGICDKRKRDRAVSIRCNGTADQHAYWSFTLAEFRRIVEWYNGEKIGG